ncbi:NADP-dependent malic enzyme [Eubacterium sp. AB3007]|uniref:NAD(P)-dependent malic enzyme n=1 Tax=Eubacterium sp. AB3007 TaxID=1392487 RepID=UPI000482CD3E|nr:malic enzyme-like NAD(P)-binding protein [Eubacterium sp. AB3007]
MDYSKIAIEKHAEWKGKLSVETKAPITNREELSIAYTPGVAAPCLEIQKNEDLAYTYTGKGNLVAVITDGTAVLGLGDIGPAAGMPVMEGKCALFKAFAGIDAVPICIDSKDPDEIVRTVQLISKSFGGINLEDISAPRCFEIERRLIELCDIPVFHDDQHGTAIIASAAILNALKVTGRKPGDLKIVFSGAGAAGISIAKMFRRFEFGDIILCDKDGAIYEGAPYNNPAQEEMAKVTNRENFHGTLAEALVGADIFVGVSRPHLVTQEMVRSMAKDPIVFSMANPVPEIMPEEAKAAGASVVGTGRSDYPNQINNVIAFPGVFRGALDCRAARITEEMKMAAARAIAGVIPEEELSPEYVLPDGFNPLVVERVAEAVAEAWTKYGG